MKDVRDRLIRLATETSGERQVLVGAALTVIWLGLVIIASFFGDSSTGGHSFSSRLLAFAGLVAPIALIWLAVWLARNLQSLKVEADDLRLALARMKAASEGDGIGPVTRPEPVRAAIASPARATPPLRTAEPQHAAAVGNPAPPELTAKELIAALNFPDGPDDYFAIAALRKSLADRELAKLIRAAQDVVTLLAAQGVYMEDLAADQLYPDLWRDFIAGTRGDAVVDLALNADDASLAKTSAMLKWDEVFRDAAQHFLRRFDRLLSDAARDCNDNVLAALVDTRSGRAFTLVAQVMGMIGGYVPEADDA